MAKRSDAGLNGPYWVRMQGNSVAEKPVGYTKPSDAIKAIRLALEKHQAAARATRPRDTEAITLALVELREMHLSPLTGNDIRLEIPLPDSGMTISIYAWFHQKGR